MKAWSIAVPVLSCLCVAVACSTNDSSPSRTNEGGAAGVADQGDGGNTPGSAGASGTAGRGQAGESSGLVCYPDGTASVAPYIECAGQRYRTIYCSDGMNYGFSCTSDGYPDYTTCKCTCKVGAEVVDQCSYPRGLEQQPCMDRIEACGFPQEVGDATDYKACQTGSDCPAFLPTCNGSACGRAVN